LVNLVLVVAQSKSLFLIASRAHSVAFARLQHVEPTFLELGILWQKTFPLLMHAPHGRLEL
jgi:hypothetical protein